mgnify:FL=1|uniref:Uncharacterized protein n=1 Tax=CrAss-like virus sp. ctcfK29 TaxID=2826827 RepID=A0A8S5MJH9_9CAUD|nr:MAG TPA: hypothetical protein [CrAss-like virus sp. ctcfK29]
MEGLSFDNILGEQEIETLFTDPEDNDVQEEHKETEEEEVETPGSDDKKQKEKDNTTEDVDPEDLFKDKAPESVGSGKDNEGKEDTAPVNDADGTSPNNFYSSIANACAVDGIFPNLDDETIKKAVDAESFSNLIEAEVNARFDEKQKRISQALENGVEPTDIKKYESTLNYINTITDAAIAEESEKGEQLRYNLIYQDFINRGMTPDKAKKFANRTVDAGTDVEDAKEALLSNKEFFSNAYNKMLQDAQLKADEDKAEREKNAKELEKSLMKDKQLFGDMEISNDIRKKAFDSVSKPVYKDPETGDYMTAIQKYESEHRAEFLKYTGLIFAMTNGFKDFDSFAKGKVKKEVKKGLRELEQTLNNTRRNNDGSLRMVTNQKDDPNSFISKGMKLDL